jgi:hypothetical protein
LLRRQEKSEVSSAPGRADRRPRTDTDTEEREKQWQEELVEKQKHKDSVHRPHHEGGGRRPRDVVDLSSDDDADKVAQPLLDQRPAMPGVDPRSLVNPAMAPVAPGGLPVPDIKLENHDIESANYSTNV